MSYTTKFSVVPGNGQVLLAMPDTDMLNIININIQSIGVEDAGDSKWCADTHTVLGSTQIEETQGAEKYCANKTSISKSVNNSTKPTVKAEADNLTRYFIAVPKSDIDKRKSAESMQQIHEDFDDVFNGIDSKPYQALPRHVAYTLQKPFQDELERLQQDVIAPLGVNETSEWCNSFVLVPKANGKVRLCLDPAWLNQALIRPIHRGPILNDILPKLNNVIPFTYRCQLWVPQYKTRQQVFIPNNICLPIWKVQI